MNTNITKATLMLAALHVLCGLDSLLAPKEYVVGPVTKYFFEMVNVRYFGMTQVLIGLIILVPGPAWRRVRNYLGGIMWLAYAVMLTYPYATGKVPTVNTTPPLVFIALGIVSCLEAHSGIYKLISRSDRKE